MAPAAVPSFLKPSFQCDGGAIASGPGLRAQEVAGARSVGLQAVEALALPGAPGAGPESWPNVGRVDLGLHQCLAKCVLIVTYFDPCPFAKSSTKKGQERGEYWVLVRFQASTWGRCQHEMTKSRNLVVADQFNNVPYCWSKVGKPRQKKTEHGDHWPTDLFKMQPEQCKSDSNNLSLAMSNPAPVVDW